jgi:hypothetical protein
MEDHRAIRAVLADYFNGLYKGDTGLLRSVFHPDAALFAQANGQSYHKPVEAYLDGVAQRPSPEALGETYRMRVLSLDIMHDIASALVHVPARGLNYYNFLSLVKGGGRWRIVNKVFSDVGPERA